MKDMQLILIVNGTKYEVVLDGCFMSFQNNLTNEGKIVPELELSTYEHNLHFDLKKIVSDQNTTILL